MIGYAIIGESGLFVKERTLGELVRVHRDPRLLDFPVEMGAVANPVMPTVPMIRAFLHDVPDFHTKGGHVVVDREQPGKVLYDDRVAREDTVGGKNHAPRPHAGTGVPAGDAMSTPKWMESSDPPSA